MCTGTAVKDHLKALVKVPEFDGRDIVYCRTKSTNTMSWATLHFKKDRYGRKM